MDTMTPEARHRCMSLIKGRDTLPERVVRKWLWHQGFRYRCNDRKLPGHPDIVLPKWKALIEVRGCFWHRHGCSLATMPKTNVRFWKTKFRNNVARDKRHEKEWAALGWKVIVVWECELRGERREATLERVKRDIKGRNFSAFALDRNHRNMI